MLNHFHDQGIRYLESEVLLRSLAIRVSPVLLALSGVLAMRHAWSVPSEHTFDLRYFVVSSARWCALAAIPLISLESALFPGGHGVSEGVAIGIRHLPFVGVFLAGLWSVGRIYRRDRRRLLTIWLSAPAGFLFGSAVVYLIVFVKRASFHWQRCEDAESVSRFLVCFF